MLTFIPVQEEKQPNNATYIVAYLTIIICDLFIDEVDSLLGVRTNIEHEGSTAIKAEFMQWWDGLETSSQFRVVVLGATNRP